jgi:hypothetical protein
MARPVAAQHAPETGAPKRSAITGTVFAGLMLHCNLDFGRADAYIRATIALWALSCEENP